MMDLDDYGREHRNPGNIRDRHDPLTQSFRERDDIVPSGDGSGMPYGATVAEILEWRRKRAERDAMKTQDEKRRAFDADDGTPLVEVDYVERHLWLPTTFIDAAHVAEFAEAVAAARQELEGAAT